ncbi:hypothetical protein PGTUg99_031758 [Puccinia graminis f. sp. tritici]|nr:hypothetical protein PGTUg99_031758 [Puccinia graminis f. sp. tritici]
MVMNLPTDGTVQIIDGPPGVRIVEATGTSRDAPPACPYCKKHTHKYCGPPNGPHDPNNN